MRNTTKLFGIIAIVAVIGFSFASCGDNGGGGYTPTAGLYRGALPNLVAEDRVDLDLEGTNLVDAAFIHVNANPGTFTLLVGAPATRTAVFAPAANVHLTIAGIGGRQTITRTGTGNLFNVDGANRSLTLGNNITLAGYAGNNNALVLVQGGASLTMNAGAQITRNTVLLANHGGGVHVTGEDSTFTMNGGEIFRNTSSGNAAGGGVRVSDEALFVMHAGAVIRDNTTTSAVSAGGVFVINSTFRMLGGEIRGNTATGNTSVAGGARISGGSFQIVSGVIYGGNEEDYPNTGTGTGTSYNALVIAGGGTATLGTMVGGAFTPGSVTLTDTDDTIRVVNGVRQ